MNLRFMLNKYILLILWVIATYYGSIKRLSSSNYEAYSIELAQNFTGEPGLGFVLAEWPVFIFLVSIVFSIIIFYSCKFFEWLLKRDFPIIIKYIIFFFSMYVYFLTVSQQIVDLIEMWKWKFYLSLIPDVVFIAFSTLVLFELWKFSKKKRKM